MKLDTDSPCLPYAENELEDCIQYEMKTESEQMRSKKCNDCFTAHAVGIFCTRISSDKHKNIWQERAWSSQIGAHVLGKALSM